jgi:hypothetical protein
MDSTFDVESIYKSVIQSVAKNPSSCLPISCEDGCFTLLLMTSYAANLPKVLNLRKVKLRFAVNYIFSVKIVRLESALVQLLRGGDCHFIKWKLCELKKNMMIY